MLNKEFFINVSKIVGSTIFAQLIGIITIPIFARIFSPSTIGQYALFTSLIGILNIFGTGRYEFALMLPKDKNKALNILIGSICIAFSWGLVLSFVFWYFKHPLSSINNYDTISNYFFLIPIVVFITCINRVFIFWFNREKLFGLNAKLNVFNALTSKLGNISLGFMGFISTASLIFVNLFVQFVEMLLRIKSFFSNKGYINYKKITYTNIVLLLKRYKKFPLIDIWNGISDSGSLLIVPIILSFYFKTDDIGLYSQSLALVQLPVVLIASAFSQVLFQRFNEAKYKGELSATISQSLALLFQIALPTFLIIFFCGKNIFSFFLGKKWEMSGLYAELLAPWCCLKFCFTPLSTIFSVTERQGLALFLTISVLFTRVLSIVIGGINDNMYMSIMLFGISGTLINGLGIIMILNLSKVKITSLLREIIKKPLPFLIVKFLQNDFTNKKRN